MIWYAIERTGVEPFPKSYQCITIGKLKFDLVHSSKSSALEGISDFIVENQILIKSDPRIEEEFKKKFTLATKVEIKTLLLG